MKKRDKAYLVSIEPPSETVDRIAEGRRVISEASSDSYKGPKNPHITLFINTYEDSEEIERRLDEVSARYESFNARVEGIHNFREDPITRASTFVYKIEGSQDLRDLQRDVVEALNSLRTDSQEKWMREQNPNYSDAQRKNIEIYGFPFGPEDWIFHTTIGTVPARDSERVKKGLEYLDKSEEWNVDGISLYEDMGEGNYELIRRFGFKN
jgi:2'-5' RNA ligase